MIREAVEEEWTRAIGGREEVGLESLLAEHRIDDQKKKNFKKSEEGIGGGGGGLVTLLSGENGRSPKGKGKEVTTNKDPFGMLVGQKIRCAVCGYTRDVRHTAEEFVQLNVPNFVGSFLYHSTLALTDHRCTGKL